MHIRACNESCLCKHHLVFYWAFVFSFQMSLFLSFDHIYERYFLTQWAGSLSQCPPGCVLHSGLAPPQRAPGVPLAPRTQNSEGAKTCGFVLVSTLFRSRPGDRELARGVQRGWLDASSGKHSLPDRPPLWVISTTTTCTAEASRDAQGSPEDDPAGHPQPQAKEALVIFLGKNLYINMSSWASHRDGRKLGTEAG